jgi:hypothetical protein
MAIEIPAWNLESRQIGTGMLGPIAPLTPARVDPGPSGFEQFQQIMQLVLPVLAAAGAYRKGALGSFTGGMLEGQQVQQRQQNEQRDFELRQKTADRQLRMEERQIKETELRHQLAETERKQREEERLDRVLARHIEAVQKNPASNAAVAAFGAKNFVMDVPGIGRINMEEALRRMPNGEVGVLPRPDKKSLVPVPNPKGKGAVYGTPKAGEPVYERERVPREPREPRLAPTIGPDGSVVYGEVKKGTPVYQEKKKPTIEVKRDIIAGLLIKYSDPETGVTREFTREEIRKLLAAQNRPSDDAMLDKVLQNPQAIALLLK